MVCVCPSIILHDGVDEVRVDSTGAACAHAEVLHMCMLAAMFDDRTYKESKGAS